MSTFLTPLFEPLGLPKLLEKLPLLDDLVLANRFPREGWLDDSQVIAWDVIQGTQEIARPNIRGAKAHMRGHEGRGRKTATSIYYNVVKQFAPSVIRALRAPGQLSKANAEAYVAREIKALVDEVERSIEYCFWGLMTGTLSLNYAGPEAAISSIVTVDYGLPTANKPTMGTSWATATVQQIVDDIDAIKQIVRTGSGVIANEAYASHDVIRYIMTAAASDPDLMSDRMKEAYWNTGELAGFQNMTWRRQESVYQASNLAAPTPYFGANSLIIGNFTANNPIRLVETAPESLKAAPGTKGRFASSWESEDVDGRFYRVEHGFCPIDERPEQRVYVADVTSA